MPRLASPAAVLAGTSVIVTRPSQDAGPLVRRARAAGAHVVRLPGLVLDEVEDRDAARSALGTAATGDIVVFTSPASVRHAFALGFALRRAPMRVFAVGGGTARVLARHGVAAIAPAMRQDGDGLLALPELAAVDGARIAIVDAPGGRDAIAPALRERGASVSRIHVYRRAPARLSKGRIDALAAAPHPWITLVSSGEALDYLGRALPADLAARWRDEPLVVSSARLAALAADAGFADVSIAASARPADLVEAACSRAAPRLRS
ncbi:uroporphyrinogen-III synthase [Dokdonella sp. MW10]|uniref:uroporphyrinogen-III synthase n=1 Tax=Dokdonella sp. MW10 TaxID=2992926 RepID=UPI003F7FF381